MTNEAEYTCENESCRHVMKVAYVKHQIYQCPKCKFSMYKTGAIVESNESDNPDHYKTGKLECIDAMRAMLGDEGFVAYLRGTLFRYNWRIGKKDEDIMEAKKIAVYTRWLNETLAGKELSK